MEAGLAPVAWKRTSTVFRRSVVSQSDWGERAGIRTSLPILSISSRTIFSILFSTLRPRGRKVYVPVMVWSMNPA